MEPHQLSRVISPPKRGMTLTFTDRAAPALAGIPAVVVEVWPPFRSGASLVTLEYAQPVKLGHEFITQIEAFVSELEPPTVPPPLASGQQPRAGRLVRAAGRRWRATRRRVSTRARSCLHKFGLVT